MSVFANQRLGRLGGYGNSALILDYVGGTVLTWRNPETSVGKL